MGRVGEIRPLAVGFTGPREAAAGVLAAARAAGYAGLHALPLNRFDPDASTWWLSPSPENPAYRYGKIIFTRRVEEPAHLFVGLYVEKGVGGSAAGPFLETARGRRWVMDEAWIWHRFSSALASGELERLADTVEVGAGVPVRIVLDAAPAVPPGARDEDAHSPSLPRDVAEFRLSRGALRLEGAHFPAGVLKGIGNPETLSVLATRVGGIPQLDWIWIDFWAGFRFALAGDPRGEIWSAAEVWQKACHPWRTWLQ